MTKVVEMMVMLTLLVFSFFLGVKYSESVKNRASWLFEIKEDDVELPDLTHDRSSEIDVIDAHGVQTETVNPVQEADKFDINQDDRPREVVHP